MFALQGRLSAQDASAIVLGKHSGRAAFADALHKMDIQIEDDDFRAAFDRFKELADRKGEISEEGIRAIVEEKTSVTPDLMELVAIHVSGGNRETPIATVTLRRNGDVLEARSEGDGMVNAAFAALRDVFSIPAILLDYRVSPLTSGADAMAEVNVIIQVGPETYSGGAIWPYEYDLDRDQFDVSLSHFADDFLACFQYTDDAERFHQRLGDRLEGFGLGLAEEKTHRIEFGRFAARDRKRRGEGKPETFDFLGFTHICSQNHSGRFDIRRQTIAKRMRRALDLVPGRQSVIWEMRRMANQLRGIDAAPGRCYEFAQLAMHCPEGASIEQASAKPRLVTRNRHGIPGRRQGGYRPGDASD